MNIIKREKEDLKFFKKSDLNLDVLLEIFSEDTTSLIYVKDDFSDEIIGVLDKYSLKENNGLDFNRKTVKFYDHEPSKKEIYEEYQSRVKLTTLGVFVNDKFYAEYRNLDLPYLPKIVAKNIMSLNYLKYFNKQVEEYFLSCGIDRIGVLGNDNILTFLSENLPRINVKIIQDNISSFDYILDFKYGNFLKQFLPKEVSTKIKNLSYLMIDITYKELKEFCLLNHVNLNFMPTNKNSKKLNLTSEEEIKMQQKFSVVFNDKKYIKEFCKTEKDYDYFSNLVFNKTILFYNDFILRMTDINIDGLNVKDGVRFSGEYPFDYINEVHFFGNCFTFGLCGPDDYTFEYQLQKMLNDSNVKVRVFNHGTYGSELLLNSLMSALNTKVRAGDSIYISYMLEDTSNEELSKYPTIEEYFVKNKDKNEIFFFDSIGHCNRKANNVIANKIFVDIAKKSKMTSKERFSYLEILNRNLRSNNFYEFNPNAYSHQQRLNKFKVISDKYNKIGMVGLYACPFTNGHKYLVDQALKKVDFLYVFIIADYFHDYDIYDRFNIAKLALKNYKNVAVLPSESYFATKQYFPEYSSKECRGEFNKNLYKQEYFNLKYLSDYLNIKYRFVGEENEDPVTKKYNEILIKLWTEDDRYLIVVPRLTFNGKNVSGSIVRKAIKDKNKKILNDLVPDGAYQYIINEMMEREDKI